ncbi:unnamed protein product [Peniophora sp. CBMAI 1063]|nr:unnamed protein product [Peniophora sp. CBMAI 1063]
MASKRPQAATDPTVQPPVSTAGQVELAAARAISSLDPAPAPAQPESRLTPEVRLVVFTSLVFPVALIPFLMLRRSLHGLHVKTDSVQGNIIGLHRKLKDTLYDLSWRREEHAKLGATVTEMQSTIASLREQMHKEQLERVEREKEWEMRMQRLAMSDAESRAQLARLRKLGASMGDVAAFMHEVEIQNLTLRPHDGRGIERLRRVAAEVSEGSNADVPRPE